MITIKIKEKKSGKIKNGANNNKRQILVPKTNMLSGILKEITQKEK